MEYDCYIRELFTNTDANGVSISVWDKRALNALDINSRNTMADIINEFGRRSCRAQGLGASITDWPRMSNGPHKLYMACKKTGGGRGSVKMATILGFLKVGKKNLFLRMSDMSATLREVEPICVLDFYVHESLQRQGIGLKLMHTFFNDEKLTAEAVAYDRPSTKLICFLRKHFGLQDYTNQSNNYVVFRKFWDFDKKIQQRQQKQHHEREENRRPVNYGMWTTINQRPLSGAKSKGRNKLQNQNAHQSPHQSPQSNVAHNNRHSPSQHQGYISPSHQSSDYLHRNSGNIMSSNNSYAFPQYGRRAYRYDANDIITQTLQQERSQQQQTFRHEQQQTQLAMHHNYRAVQDSTQPSHSQRNRIPDNNENEVDKRVLYGRRARGDFNDFDDHHTLMTSSRIPAISKSIQDTSIKTGHRSKQHNSHQSVKSGIGMYHHHNLIL